MLAEKKRLKENKKREHYWKRWGPYLTERQWGTVREDYSKDGRPWDYFTYEDAISRAYRWGEDGIAGLSDTHQRLCLAFAFWNGKDPFLKERIFGLANLEGNHGEDVKEYYYFLDNVPTHSYMKYLYKYPQSEYPYHAIRTTNAKRTQKQAEYELVDTGIFKHNRYFDIFIEYAKSSSTDIYIRITLCNRGNEEHILHVLPTLWSRNTWFAYPKDRKPLLEEKEGKIQAFHPSLGTYYLYGDEAEELLFTENETNDQKIMGASKRSGFAKDGFHDYIVRKDCSAVNSKKKGTKAAYHYKFSILPKEEKQIYLRLTKGGEEKKPLQDAPKIFRTRLREAEEFYGELFPPESGEDRRRIGRQAIAGMLWNKMHYNLIIADWLKGDESFRPPLLPHDPYKARNSEWLHLYSDDIFSVPDTWEFPQFFSWDSAFHAIPLAMVDPEFAKRQLYILAQEWYMHPNGQLAAYEWNFYDVNPPVHAWATWRVYKIEQRQTDEPDRFFLERVFQKLLLNFTWWVNRKDTGGRNIFQGGFLGLDNISVFNRSEHLPANGTLYQSDATSWMGMFCLNMLTISIELAKENHVYEDMANKFYNHFLLIADAINFSESHLQPLWNEKDGFYYDILKLPTGEEVPIKVHSLVGLMPLLAVMTIDSETLESLPIFKNKVDWFIKHRSDLCDKVACMEAPGINDRRILAILDQDKLKKLLKIMLDEDEFLSPYGIRSVSKYHAKNPFHLEIDGRNYCVDYEPGESTSRLFGGNSNWRGPIWFPINVLIIESLQKFHHYHGDDFKVECPTGSGNMMNLWEVSCDLSNRLIQIFEKDDEGTRPVFGNQDKFNRDPHFQDCILFHEYFHGDTGQGLGANHQMGWTGFVAKLIKQLSDYGYER